MLTTTSAQIAAVTGGRLVGGATGTEEVTGRARIDSRAVQPGDLFAAFVGEHVDGHLYLHAAAEAGASLALISAEEHAQVPAVLVEDVQAALAALAHDQLAQARRRREDLLVVAVTGSAGKTGTKDMLGAVLGTTGPVVAPAGSHNNELGLPLTVLELDENTRFLVLEMGARGIGHIAHLTSIATPDISLVLNVGNAHLGEFGSVDAIAQAKGEILEALPASGRAVLNADDPRVAAMATRTAAPVVTWGIDHGDVRTGPIGLDEDAHPTLHVSVPEGLLRVDGEPVGAGQAEITIPLVGEHQGLNALAALTAALLAGVDLPVAAEALAHAEAVSGQRMETARTADGTTVINDAYNASPASMRLALRTLAHLGRKNRTVAVLGQMRELGEDSIRLHDEVGRLAVRLNIDQLVVVGPGARAIHNGACLDGSFGGESVYAETVDEALAVLETTVRPGDVVLLKSSRDAGVRDLGPRLLAALNREADA